MPQPKHLTKLKLPVPKTAPKDEDLAKYFAMLALGLTALAFVFMMASGGMQPALNVPGTD
ncbi:MAG: hypothetical protein K0S54_2864, partial [Alphaproteobacteria bacterium]|nr:hypothetical protein [Alphaproteobacteria bacterium]